MSSAWVAILERWCSASKDHRGWKQYRQNNLCKAFSEGRSEGASRAAVTCKESDSNKDYRMHTFLTSHFPPSTHPSLPTPPPPPSTSPIPSTHFLAHIALTPSPARRNPHLYHHLKPTQHPLPRGQPSPKQRTRSKPPRRIQCTALHPPTRGADPPARACHVALPFPPLLPP